MIQLYPICGQEYFTKEHFSVQEVTQLYLGYFENLLEYIKAYRAEVKYVNYKELLPRYSGNYTDRSKVYNDRFINSGLFLKSLGEDIEKNGTYWAFICYRDGRIKEGGHRYDALQSINSNRKVMAVIIDDINTGFATQKELKTQYAMKLFFPENDIKRFYKTKHRFSDFKKIGKSLYYVTTNHLAEIDQILIRYSMYLSWLLFEYHGQIKPVDFVNGEEAFFKWKAVNRL